MPLSVASSFSEAELMSISSPLGASALAGAASFLASVLAGALASVLGVSAFWAKARPVAAMAATRKAKILFIAAVPPRSGGRDGLVWDARAAETKNPAEAGSREALPGYA